MLPGAAYLIPISRFGGLAWLVTAAVLLPVRRLALVLPRPERPRPSSPGPSGGRTGDIPAPEWWLVRAVQRRSSAGHAARCVVGAAVDPGLAQPSRRLVHGTRTSRPISADPELARRDLLRARASAAAIRQTADPDSRGQ